MGSAFVICYIRANDLMHGHIFYALIIPTSNPILGYSLAESIKKNPLSRTGGCLLLNELGAPPGHGKVNS